LAKGVPRTIYSRRRGKPLRVGRREVLERLLPRLQLIPADHQDGTLDPRGLFKTDIRSVWLEIGFGAGEHLAAMAQAHPDIGFIGCEPFINGVARLLSVIDEQGLDNIRIVTDDAGLLLDCLAAGSIERAFLLFPDPWPKRRHNKRRFVCAKNIAALAQIGSCGPMTGRQPDMKARALKLAGHRFFLVFDDGTDNGPAADEP
jgi:tRNA (guanine-N7-)-methyltransferase